MSKVTSFNQYKTKIIVGVLSVSLAGILSVCIYKYIQNRQKKPVKPKVPSKKVSNIVSSTPKRILSEKELLQIISSIKKLCNEELKALRNKYRIERRKMFYDEEAYQALIDEYDSKLLQILETASEKVFERYQITHANFDEAIKLYVEDEEINSAVDSMATVEEDCKVPEQMTKELLLEIFNYNNKRCNEAVFESHKNVEYLNTRIQDEIYFKYKIEMEELTACYKKFNCEKDPDFLPKIDEMQKSMTQYVNSSN